MLKVLELFSGIGGMRLAYCGATGPEAALPQWRAMEVDETCLKTYTQLFGSAPVGGVRANEVWNNPAGPDEVWRCSIDKLPDEAFEGFDLWLMSPPCQPFTRTGRKRDLDDRRCAALLRLLDALPKLGSPPKAFMLENVPEFRGSRAHKAVRAAIDALGRSLGTTYVVEENMLNSMDFGFPNSRRRFFLTAVSGNALSARDVDGLPRLPGVHAGADRVDPEPVGAFCKRAAASSRLGLEQLAKDLRVSTELIFKAKKAEWTLDVATATSSQTKTFTGSYGKKDYGGEGLSKAGPLLLTASAPARGSAAASADLEPAAEALRRFGPLPKSEWRRVRYFAPAEVLALQGFPEGWELPASLGVRQQWRLIGNSINVTVARHVLERLLARIQ